MLPQNATVKSGLLTSRKDGSSHQAARGREGAPGNLQPQFCLRSSRGGGGHLQNSRNSWSDTCDLVADLRGGRGAQRGHKSYRSITSTMPYYPWTKE